MDKTEFRFSPGVEFRAVGGGPGTAFGVAINYGEIADIAGQFRETFVSGCFDVAGRDDIMATVQHQRSKMLGRSNALGGLRLDDQASRLNVELTLPDTTEGRDASELLRIGVIAGWSMEFMSEDERVINEIREITRAHLIGVSLVDRPAYPNSVAKMRAEAERSRPRRLWL